VQFALNFGQKLPTSFFFLCDHVLKGQQFVFDLLEHLAGECVVHVGQSYGYVLVALLMLWHCVG
jgi:hypothetical protein